MSVQHYDNDGKRIGESKSYYDLFWEGVGSLLVYGGIFYFLAETFIWLTEKISNWESLDTPYNYIFAFYHYILQIPIEFLVDKISWIFSINITSYSNLNIVINITIIITLLIFILMIFKKILLIMNLTFKDFFILLLVPAFLCGILFVFIEIYNWLVVIK